MRLLDLSSQVAPSPIQQLHSPITRLPCFKRRLALPGAGWWFSVILPKIHAGVLSFWIPRQGPDQHASADRNFFWRQKFKKVPFPKSDQSTESLPSIKALKQGPSTPVRLQHVVVYLSWLASGLPRGFPAALCTNTTRLHIRPST